MLQVNCYEKQNGKLLTAAKALNMSWAKAFITYEEKKGRFIEVLNADGNTHYVTSNKN